VEAVIHLDTHVVAWLFAGRLDLLSEPARSVIEAEDLVISPMVILELEYLFEINRTTQPGRIVADDLRERLVAPPELKPGQPLLLA
jgi:PIN domain nuclease of toxin-antitoxin system